MTFAYARRARLLIHMILGQHLRHDTAYRTVRQCDAISLVASLGKIPPPGALDVKAEALRLQVSPSTLPIEFCPQKVPCEWRIPQQDAR